MSTREPELYKDKIEVSLDGRQIFYLFFGGAVIVGMVFVLGVLVGRRVEARGHIARAQTSADVDPLAALDRLEGNGGLSFRGALTGRSEVTGGSAPTGKDAESDVERAIGELEKARRADKAAPARPMPAPEADVHGAQPAKLAPPPALAPAAAPTPADPKPPAKPADKAVEKAKPAEPKADATAQLDKPIDKPSEVKANDKPADPKPPEPRYTLQLSAFQDKGEAEAYLSTVKASGYQAYITRAEVDGKGTWYRIRLGSYRSMDAANGAKVDYEKTSKQSANVIKL